MTDADRDRLMGWKAIGNFVGRDARTMRRWEIERGLPVHRVRSGGSGSGSIWADKEEVRAWMASETVPQSPDTLAPASPNPFWRGLPGRFLVGSALLAAAAPLVVSKLGYGTAAAGNVAAAPFGPDAGANETYRSALYAMNTRSAAGLLDAAQKFGVLAARHPDNAKAFVGLAETNLLLREFNSIPEEVAYRRANFAAQKALALDPGSAGALRSLGFVKYWSDGARAEGLDLFRRAIAQAPDDAQSYHWYGTALLGEGRFAEALAALDHAHALNPGSSAIGADEAVIRYTKGDRSEALAALRQITQVDPNFSAAHNYLARFYLIEKNDLGFLTEAAVAARLKGDAVRERAIRAAAEAYRTGGHPAMLASLTATAEHIFQQTGQGTILIAMLYAVSGDRAKVLAWLTRAESVQEPAIRSLIALAEFVPYRDDPAFQRFFRVS